MDVSNSAIWNLIRTEEMQVVALRLAIALACGNDNVNKNSLNEYFIQKDMFPSLIKVNDYHDTLLFALMFANILVANIVLSFTFLSSSRRSIQLKLHSKHWLC